MAKKTSRLSPKEQYQLAYRFARLGLAAELNPDGSTNVYRSFGISPEIYNAAHGHKFDMGAVVIGWRKWSRMYDFKERLEEVREAQRLAAFSAMGVLGYVACELIHEFEAQLDSEAEL